MPPLSWLQSEWLSGYDLLWCRERRSLMLRPSLFVVFALLLLRLALPALAVMSDSESPRQATTAIAAYRESAQPGCPLE